MPDHEINDDKVAVVLEMVSITDNCGNVVDVHQRKALHFSILHDPVE
jgi:hypothetical protein